MSQFNLYLERVQEQRNYYYESSAEEYKKKGYHLGYDSKWRNPAGRVLKKPKYETEEQKSDALFNDPIRKALREPAEKAKWDGTISLTPQDKKTLHNIFIKTPIAALISLGLLLSQALPLKDVKFDNIKYNALQEIENNHEMTNEDKRKAMFTLKSIIDNAKSEKLNTSDIENLKQINLKASEQIQKELESKDSSLLQKIKNFF